MVKLRSAYYCNLKLMLIWLMIFAHWIEPLIGDNPALYRLYRWIYLFHMPLFVFLSGLFLKTPAACLSRLRRTAALYLLCQSLAVASGNASWDTPWWTLWYLLSLGIWQLLSALLLQLCPRRWLILLFAAAAGCLAGKTDLGRAWSLSRTIVFFPWFWLGVLLPPRLPWHRLRLPGLLCLVLLLILDPQVSAVTLYQAGPCDPLIRLRCYGYALLAGLFLLSWCPRRRFPWTRAGADTLPAYLLHGPIVGVLRPLPHPWLLTTVFLYLCHLAMRWRGLYGITGKEVCPWQDLKRSTDPRDRQSTAFSCR